MGYPLRVVLHLVYIDQLRPVCKERVKRGSGGPMVQTDSLVHKEYRHLTPSSKHRYVVKKGEGKKRKTTPWVAFTEVIISGVVSPRFNWIRLELSRVVPLNEFDGSFSTEGNKNNVKTQVVNIETRLGSRRSPVRCGDYTKPREGWV